MTRDELLENIAEDVREIRKELGEFRVSTEHRLTKVEQRASIYGAVSGAILGVISSIVYPWHK